MRSSTSFIAPPHAAMELANGIPGSRYIEVADAAHGLPITHAALVNDLLTKHLLSDVRVTGHQGHQPRLGPD